MLGMIYWPLNRRRTLLSIPLGFLQLGASFLYVRLMTNELLHSLLHNLFSIKWERSHF